MCSVYSDTNDPLSLGALKKKLSNYLHNREKRIEPFDLIKVTETLKQYDEETVWLCFRKEEAVGVLFFTFKPLIEEARPLFI